MLRKKFKRIAAIAMALLMVLSVVSWDGFAFRAKAAEYSADFSLRDDVYMTADGEGEDIQMGDILVKLSDDSDWISLTYGNDSNSVDVSDCDSFKLMWGGLRRLRSCLRFN